jgi:hypothetical protein
MNAPPPQHYAPAYSLLTLFMGVLLRRRCDSFVRGENVFRQYYAQRFRSMYPAIVKRNGRKTVYCTDPRDRQIGTIPVGTILYIQDGVNPFHGLTRTVVQREPWIVEGWLPRDYAKWDGATRTFQTVRIRGGHLAVVRSLRNRRRAKTVADWILLACLDAGLEKFS